MSPDSAVYADAVRTLADWSDPIDIGQPVYLIGINLGRMVCLGTPVDFNVGIPFPTLVMFPV